MKYKYEVAERRVLPFETLILDCFYKDGLGPSQTLRTTISPLQL